MPIFRMLLFFLGPPVYIYIYTLLCLLIGGVKINGGSIENRRLHRPKVKNYTTESETNFRKLISGGGAPFILSTRVMFDIRLFLL